MINIYVLDTSVIVTDPQCLSSFPNSHVIIQINVLNELDSLKTRTGETGKNARIFARKLEKISAKGDINKGVELTKEKIKLSIDTANTNGSGEYGDPTYVDNQILNCAKRLQERGNKVALVSRDINLRIRARAFGVKAIDYHAKKTLTSEFYSGFRTISNSEFGNQLVDSKYIECSPYQELDPIFQQECVHFKSDKGRGLALGRRVNGSIKLIDDNRPWNLKTKNIEHAFAVDLLLDPNVPLVSLAGIAGTGKTLVTVACGLEAVINRGLYNKMIIYRPIHPMGTDIGYLPGDMQDKLDPWMAAIKDSMEFLSSKSRKGRKSSNRDSWKDSLAQYGDMIHMDALTYIRGRSINNAFIIVDECQNVSKEEIKTILTRVGAGTKVVLTGDVEQIDNHRLDAQNNGLSYTIEKFKNSELAGHVTFTKGERSPLATLSAHIL